MQDVLFLNRADVTRLLSLEDCIDAVADAFARHARGDLPAAPGVLGTHVAGGGFHVKTATLGGSPATFVAKINANFPGNPARGLPTIQGVLALFEVESGRPLALMDSSEITILRTAAASAAAARQLALPHADTVTVIGCGVQGRAHLRALRIVRPIQRAWAIDAHPGRAEAFAAEMTSELNIEVVEAPALDDALAASAIWVTCTSAHAPVIASSLLRRGVFIAAVGADNPDKQELEPELLARSRVVTDLTAQAATMGELHHAIAAGVMRQSDVHAELGQILTGERPARMTDEETFVFDSTGTALQDCAAAGILYRRAVERGAGLALRLT